MQSSAASSPISGPGGCTLADQGGHRDVAALNTATSSTLRADATLEGFSLRVESEDVVHPYSARLAAYLMTTTAILPVRHPPARAQHHLMLQPSARSSNDRA